MKRLADRIWHELTRERGATPRRARTRRRSRSGIALLVVLATMALMITVTTETSFKSTVRVRMAANHRDEAKAEYLAESGMAFYRLLLVQSKANDSMLKQFGMSGDMIWQQLPFVNTGLMRMVFVTDGADEDDIAALESEGLTEEEREESREGSTSTKRSFLDFDGDFFAEVVDEDQKINVARISATDFTTLQSDPIAVQLYSLMTGTDRCDELRGGEFQRDEEEGLSFFYNRSLEPWELIGNLVDWVDPDSTRAYQGGDENVLYDTLDDPYRPKNAPFDTHQEVRLVDGWHRDDVWERYGEYLTTFGSGKINVNTAECEVLWALLKSYTDPQVTDDVALDIIRQIDEARTFVPFSNARQFVDLVTNARGNPVSTMTNQISTQSRTFRVVSGGQVGDAVVTIEAVFEFAANGSPEGKVLLWKVR